MQKTIDEARDILQCLFPLHRMVLEQHADVHDDVNIGWTIDLGTLRRASKFILSSSTVTSTPNQAIEKTGGGAS